MRFFPRISGRRPRTTLALPAVLAFSLAASACTNGADTLGSPSDSTDLSSSDVILTSARLETLGSCDALLDRFIEIGLERVGPYGFGTPWGWFFDDFAVEEFDDAMEEDSASFETASADGEAASDFSSQGAGDDRSGTNNQEAGVDEADLVKTDGNRIVTLSGNKINVVDITGDEPRLARTIALDDNMWASEMFLSGDTALIMTNGWTDTPFLADRSSDMLWPHGTNTSTIVEVNIETGELGRSIEFEGSTLSAREIDGTVRIVVSSTIGKLPFLFPSTPGAEESATDANRALVEKSTIDNWLPTFRIVEPDGSVSSEGPAIECDRMHLPDEHSGFGAVSVLTVDLSDGLQLKDALGVVTDGQTVYASTDRLTVATARWPEFNPETGEPVGDEDYSTALHTFDITDTERATYIASGEVTGSLLSQYSLSEHNGVLRVATTAGEPWGAEPTSESFVTTFGEQDGALVQLGQVGGLGKGERIFSVRFMGDTAYVVTFRQVDPLYTVDLSDPAAPAVLGELKIPGFSTYLHPVGEGLILGIGQDASEEGIQTGAQVSLFDVSDLSNPQRISQLTFGENTYSSIDWDPKAFLHWAPADTAFVPISWWGWDEETDTDQSGSASVLVSTAGTELVETARVAHPVTRQCEPNYAEEEIIEIESAVESGDLEEADAEAYLTELESQPEEYCWEYQAEIRRSVIVGDTLYTISEAGLQANALDGLAERGFVSFNG